MNVVLIRVLDLMNKLLAFVIIGAGVIVALISFYRAIGDAQTLREAGEELLFGFGILVLAVMIASVLCGFLATIVDIRDQLDRLNGSARRRDEYYRPQTMRR